MAFLLVVLCIAGIVVVYFTTNPMLHGRPFLIRRFVNWFPLGMTYAFLYMARYNLNVAQLAVGEQRMSSSEFGWIFFAGTVTYAFSFLPNGPLVDKIGGKRGIIISALGACLANSLMGYVTWLAVTNRTHMRLFGPFCALYALNMYFQSYGAMSIIKVKAYWFHVRERGVFGAVFGTLISLGVYLAFDTGKSIVDMAKAHPKTDQGWLLGAIQNIIQKIFVPASNPVDAVWAVFFVPAAILVFWAILDYFLIVDTPEEAKFPPFDTHDASSGQMHIELTTGDLLKKVFTSRLMLLLAGVELTAGVLRNGTMQWEPKFAKDMKRRSMLVTPADLKGGPAFVTTVRDSDALPPLLAAAFDAARKAETNSPAKTSTPPVGGSQERLLAAVNEVIQGPSIYEPGRFAGVTLRTETKELLDRKPRDLDLVHLNRMLLEDAYPAELARWRSRPSAEFFIENWGFLLFVFGVLGGFSGGMISDRLFQSRRGPPAAIFCGVMFLLTVVMAAFLSWPAVVGAAAAFMAMFVIGVHSLMSGTAAADFGGRKATATCSGIVDGFVYLGSGIQSACLGNLITVSWLWWPLFMMPFAVIGGVIALRFWHALPEATKRYNAEVSRKAIRDSAA